MLDGLPPQARHLVLMLVAALLAWAGTDLVPWLEGQEGWAAVLGPLVTVLLAWATPLTRQYGVGVEKARARAWLNDPGVR